MRILIAISRYYRIIFFVMEKKSQCRQREREREGERDRRDKRGLTLNVRNAGNRDTISTA